MISSFASSAPQKSLSSVHKDQHMHALRTQRFFEMYPILLFFQHNNMSAAQWKRLKSTPNCAFLVIKNTHLAHYLAQRVESTTTYGHLFQGPCFLVGLEGSADIHVARTLDTLQLPIVFLGGYVEDQWMNHLDFQKYRSLDARVYSTCLDSMQTSTPCLQVLSAPSQTLLSNLQYHLVDLLQCLSLHKGSSANPEGQ